MSGGSKIQASKLLNARWWLVIILAAGLSACGIAPSQTPAKPTPCMPDAGNANPYNSPAHPWVDMIYRSSGIVVETPPTNIPGPGSQDLQVLAARNAALKFLIEETFRWTDIRTIRLSTSSEVHIIITYIHPELIQAAYLSEILEKKHMVQDINAHVNQVISEVARREELLFMMTVISNHQDPFNMSKNKLTIPVGKLNLTNSENIPIPPSHYDPNLDQPIDTTQEPVFGLVAYPIGIQSNSRCLWVLDNTYNTNIVIVTDTLLIDDVNGDSHAWTIRYKPLIDPGIPMELPDFSQPNYDIRQLPSAIIPPGNINDVNFWRDYSRFIWKQILYGK